MQTLVFFIHNYKNYGLASNIGNLYMNRFIIDEDAGHEIEKIYEVEQFLHCFNFVPSFTEDKKRIGMSHIFYKVGHFSR